MVKKGFILIILAFALLQSFALELNGKVDHYAIEYDDVLILKDQERIYSIDDVISDELKSSFVANKYPVVNMGFYDGVVWLKFKLTNESSEYYQSILEVREPNLDIIEVYEIQKDTFSILGKGGDFFNYNIREIDHKFYQFHISLFALQEKEYLIRIDNHGRGLAIPLDLYQPTALAKRDYSLQTVFGVFYGLLLFAFFLNLFSSLLIGGKSNLHYLLFILALSFSELSADGIIFKYILTENSYMANYGYSFFSTMAIFFLLKFTQSFLSTKKILPKVNVVLSIFSYALLVIAGMSLVNDWSFYKYTVLSMSAVAFFLNFIILTAAVLAIRKKFLPARFFLIGVITLLISLFFIILRNYGLINGRIYTDYIIKIAASIQVILFSLALIDRFKLVRDQSMSRMVEMNELKVKQNEMLEIQVADRTREINTQKVELEVKNKEIVDSINYAKRIQSAILPPMKEFNDLLKEGFVYYQPKDIVAGDFYWLQRVGDKVLFAVADCTGHGVPGAMVSVVCHNSLNEAVNEFGLTQPSEILDKVTDLVIATFQRSEKEVLDGMDISLCSYNIKDNTLEYAGAYNSLYFVRDNELDVVKADKQPIGNYENRKPFTNHIKELKTGDLIYLFTDGYADQFGGEKGKKLKSKHFKELLLANSEKDMASQKVALENFFIEWKSKLEQIDDVCVMGVRF